VITVMGEALVDIIVDPHGEVTSVVGGAPLNTARTLGRLGHDVAFLGGVSQDAFGRRIRRLVEDDGVLLALDGPVPEPTTLAIAELDEDGAATYRFLLDGTAAAAVTPDRALACLPDSAAVHVGTLGLVLRPLALATAAVVASARDDQLVMVDPNMRPSVMGPGFAEVWDEVAARADVVKVSGDDLAHLAPGVVPLDAARALHERHGSVVLFTDGAAAVHVLVGGTDTVLDVPCVPVVDTVGAGDSFSGGFLAAFTGVGLGRSELADRDAVVAAARYGIAVAGITCQRAGADPPFADEVEVTR
jgi:fructokinase